MKKFVTIIMLLMAVVLVVPEAEAKRFGGGKSWGKSKSFSSAPAKSTNKASPTNSGTNTAVTPVRKPGMMGGLMGGLLAGGLIAALIGGGAFEGIQMMDILLIGGLVYFGLRLLGGNRHAAASSSYQRAGQGTYDSASSDYQPSYDGFAKARELAQGEQNVPFNFTDNFDQAGFVEGARGHFDTLQRAWNANKLEVMQEYLSIELFNQLAEERRSYGDQEINNTVLFVDAEIVRADHSMLNAEVSVQFKARIKDEVTLEETDVTEVWHLERQLDQAQASWLIVGIEQF